LRVKPFLFVLAAMLILELAGPAQAPDPAHVLQATSERLLDDLKRMPRYTCVQTITRTYYTGNQSGHPSCSKLIAEHDERKKKLPIQSWDRLRLEVALVEGGSVYSWVGAPRFTDDTLDKLAGSGPLGSGDFGVFLSGILHHATLSFQGERTEDGTRLLEYSYEMPVGKSSYRVKMPNGWAVTGYDGTMLLDPETDDLVKLVVRTNELPSASLACQAISEVTYRRTPIHQRTVLVPHETKLYTISTTGNESTSETSYSNCREYSSTIKMVFGNETMTSSSPAPASNPAPAPAPALPLPSGLRFSVHVTTPIDADKAAAGDPIEAVLTAPMHDKKKAIIAPTGARLHGRLRTVKVWIAAWNTVQIGIQFESIEIEGKSVPLNAIYLPVRPMYFGSSYGMRSRIDNSFTGGTFFFDNAHIRPKDLDSDWVTVTPSEQKEEKNKK
jgi:hypothetical protein